MLPDPEDTAAHRAKCSIHVVGTLDVPLDFLHPVRVVVRRKWPLAVRAGMPEGGVGPHLRSSITRAGGRHKPCPFYLLRAAAPSASRD